MIDVTKPLETVDGKPVKYVGTLTDGRILVEVTYGSLYAIDRHTVLETRRADGRKGSGWTTSGDDLRNKVVERVIYRNVYADGTVGETSHATEQAARERSKFGKVRVGLLKQTFHNGKLAHATLVSGTPWFRDRSIPTGRTANAEDYTRQ